MQLRHRLAEIDSNALVVDEDSIHLKVRLLCRGPLIKLDEGVLQRIARRLITDDLAAEDLAESTEDELQVLGACHWIEFANEEDVLRWPHFSKGQVAYHFERESSRRGIGLALGFLFLLFCALIFDLICFSQTN